MEVKTGRDLHKSLDLLPKKCKKVLPLFVDFRLKSSNLKKRSRIILSVNYYYMASLTKQNRCSIYVYGCVIVEANGPIRYLVKA